MTIAPFCSASIIPQAGAFVIGFNQCLLKQYKTKSADNLSSFPDKETVSKYATRGISWAVSFGLINGKGTGTGTILAPKGHATRAEVASILMRYNQNKSVLEPLNDPRTCNHNWKVSTYKKPTCMADGSETLCCEDCNTEKTTVLPRTGHVYQNGHCTICGIEDPNAHLIEMTAEEIYAACSPAVFTIHTYDKNGNGIAQGSGFFVSSDGVAVTNHHVVEDASVIEVILKDGRSFRVGELVAVNATQDWAVFKINNIYNAPYLVIGDRSTVVGGASVYAIGSPKGISNTISAGIISNPNSTINGVSMIQMTASISHGSSGGALINKYGQVIGITSGNLTSGNDLYFSMPIYYAATPLRENGVNCP